MALDRYSFGHVVLVPFPFTDQTGGKKRPAVVISSTRYNAERRDVVIMAITSQMRSPLGFGEAMVAQWEAAGLIKPSVLKPVFATIGQRLVLRTMGQLLPADRATLQKLVATAIG